MKGLLDVFLQCICEPTTNRRVVQGGSLARSTNGKNGWSRITDRIISFFLNQENKQVRYHFWWPVFTLEKVFEESKLNSKWLSQSSILQIAHPSHSRHTTLTIQSTCVSKSLSIELKNHEYRAQIQVFHGSRKTFRSRVTKNNFLNSRFTENKII